MNIYFFSSTIDTVATRGTDVEGDKGRGGFERRAPSTYQAIGATSRSLLIKS